MSETPRQRAARYRADATKREHKAAALDREGAIIRRVTEPGEGMLPVEREAERQRAIAHRLRIIANHLDS